MSIDHFLDGLRPSAGGVTEEDLLRHKKEYLECLKSVIELEERILARRAAGGNGAAG